MTKKVKRSVKLKATPDNEALILMAIKWFRRKFPKTDLRP